MPDFYRLVKRKVYCSAYPAWKRVKLTQIRTCDAFAIRSPKVLVSTIFLGVNLNVFEKDEPKMFETMVFGSKYNQEREHYSTYDKAVKGHKEWVKKVKAKAPF